MKGISYDYNYNIGKFRNSSKGKQAQALKEGLSFFMSAADAKIVKLVIEEI